MEDMKGNLYSLSGKIKNGWTQSPGVSIRPEPRAEATVMPAMPEVNRTIPYMPEVKLPMPVMPEENRPIANMPEVKLPMSNMPEANQPVPATNQKNYANPIMPETVDIFLTTEPESIPAARTDAYRTKKCETLAMAWIIDQKWDETYEPELGFKRGTLFPALDLPFLGEGACRHE